MDSRSCGVWQREKTPIDTSVEALWKIEALCAFRTRLTCRLDVGEGQLGHRSHAVVLLRARRVPGKGEGIACHGPCDVGAVTPLIVASISKCSQVEHDLAMREIDLVPHERLLPLVVVPVQAIVEVDSSVCDPHDLPLQDLASSNDMCRNGG